MGDEYTNDDDDGGGGVGGAGVGVFPPPPPPPRSTPPPNDALDAYRATPDVVVSPTANGNAPVPDAGDGRVACPVANDRDTVLGVAAPGVPPPPTRPKPPPPPCLLYTSDAADD